MRKKILIFTPGAVGGAERMCITIGEMLPKDRFDVQYVILGNEKRIYNIIPEGSNVDCIHFRKIYQFVTLRIWWKLITYKPDIVYSSLALFNPRVIFAAKLARKKTIIRSSGMIGDYKWLDFWKIRISYPFADLLIAQQEDMRVQMATLLSVPLKKIVTLYNPIDFTDIDNKKNVPSPFLQKGNINYVNAARISYVKGHDIAIKAMKEVKKHLPNAHLYFVGGYDESDEYYRSLVKLTKDLGLNDCIHFVGFDSNPFRWIKNCDCFVFPSRKEGLPNALVEASYLGVPTVATQCLRVVDEIVVSGFNGFTVKVDDYSALSQAMEKAINLKNFKMTYQPSDPENFIHVFDCI